MLRTTAGELIDEFVELKICNGRGTEKFEKVETVTCGKAHKFCKEFGTY